MSRHETGLMDMHLADLGNGDIRRGYRLLQALAERLAHARRKHPWPRDAPGNEGAFQALMGEMAELNYAITQHEPPQRVIDEALDTAVVALRMWQNEQHVAR